MDQKNSRYVVVTGVDYSETSELALNQAFVVASEKADAEVHVDRRGQRARDCDTFSLDRVESLQGHCHRIGSRRE